MKTQNKTRSIFQVVYDKKTGRILQTHRTFEVQKGKYCEVATEEIKKLALEDDFAMDIVSDKNPNNLAVLTVKDRSDRPFMETSSLIVDTKLRKMIEKPSLKLSASKTELEGDGIDSSVITLKVINSKGKLLKSFNGTIKVTTSRGKLSTKGGVVEIKKGAGKITLTSVNETVDRVKISAQCLKGRCKKAGLDLEFT